MDHEFLNQPEGGRGDFLLFLDGAGLSREEQELCILMLSEDRAVISEWAQYLHGQGVDAAKEWLKKTLYNHVRAGTRKLAEAYSGLSREWVDDLVSRISAEPAIYPQIVTALVYYYRGDMETFVTHIVNIAQSTERPGPEEI